MHSPTIRRVSRALPLLVLSLMVGCVQTASRGGAERGDGGSIVDDGVVESAPGEAVADPAPIDGYRLGQGDRIAIQVFDEPDLTMDATVGASGRIGYSYLGDLTVRDKTTAQIEREITTLLADGYLRNPSVNVTVLEYRPFFINGEVRSPGSYPYQPGLTMDRAISLAGGLTDRASRRKMTVIKADGSGDEVEAVMSTPIAPGDIVSIEEGFF